MKKTLLFACMLAFSLLQAQVIQDFEGDITTEGWSLYKSNPGSDGFDNSNGIFYEGAQSYFYSGNTQYSESWMVSPAHTCGANDELSFYYYHRFISQYDYSGVWVSTTGSDPLTNPGDYTELVELNASSPGGFSENTWTQHIEDFTSYSGQTVYIAFKVLGGTNQALHLDNFSLGVPCELPTYTLDVVTNCPAEDTYTVDFNITDMGTSTSFTVYNNQGMAPTTMSGVGVHSAGPFLDGFSVELEMISNTNVTCSPYVIGTFLNAPCPPPATTITCGTPSNFTHCYGNNELTQYVFTSSDGTSPLQLVFNQGNTEADYDTLFVYDGVDANAPLLYSGFGNGTTTLTDLSGLTFNSTGSSLYLRHNADNSTSCNNTINFIDWDFDVNCFNCMAPTATAVVVPDCVGGASFSIDVDLTDMGDATSIDIVNDAGVVATTVTTTGMYTVGPFTNGTSVSIDLVHNTDNVCDLALGAFTGVPCNDDLCDAIAMTIDAAPITFSNEGATQQTGEFTGSCFGGTATLNSVWFSFIAPATGYAVVSTDFPNTTLHDTQVAVWSLPGGDCSAIGDLSGVDCDQDGGESDPNAWTSIVELEGLTPGETYYVQVDGYGTDVGSTMIQVTAPFCEAPTNLSVANITTDNGEFSWTPGGTESSWFIEVGPTGFTPGSTGTTYVSGNNSGWTVPSSAGLMPNTTYDVYITSNCGANEGGTSVASLITFTTLGAASCDDVSAVGTSNVTSSTMNVSWTDNAGSGAVIIEYGVAGFTPGSGTTVSGTTSPYTVTGLMASTSYDIYVTADCGANGTGNAVGPTNTSTSAATGSCSDVSGIMTSNVTVGTVDVSWTDNAGATSWEIEYVATGGAQGSGTVVTANSNPFTISGLMSNSSYEVYVRAICGAGDESNWSGGAGTGFTTMSTTTPCLDPTDLTTSNITSTSADFGWTENGSATMWSVEYGAAGFTPGSGTTITASTNPVSVTGLMENSSYSFIVQAICDQSAGNVSGWSTSSASFSTLGTDVVSLGNGQSVDVYSYNNIIVLSFDNVDAPSANVLVYDILGQVVASENMETVGTQRIELNTVSTGFYLVRMDIDNATNTIKVFINNK